MRRGTSVRVGAFVLSCSLVAAAQGSPEPPAAPAFPPGEPGVAPAAPAPGEGGPAAPGEPPPPAPPQGGAPAAPPSGAPPPPAPPGYAPPPAGSAPPPAGYAPPAYGQPGYGPGYGSPPYGEPPLPPPEPGVHLHDGFYLRLGLGVGYGNVNSTGTAGSSDVEVTYKGFGPVYELLIGGTPGGGLVIGGGFVGQDISEPEIEVTVGSGSASTQAPDNSALGVVVLGPFVDWFPDETGGAHVGLIAGIGGIGVQDQNGDSATGFGAALFGGYDFWVGKQWSIGPEARVVYVSADRDSGSGTLQSSFDDKATSFELLFTALLH
ncbi:MAG: autotransporter outer membrane beta-barrel domain-containing protein [Polyangiaceae bacterium]